MTTTSFLVFAVFVCIVVVILATIHRRNKTITIPSGTLQLTGDGWVLDCRAGTGTEQVIQDKKQVIMYSGNQYETNGHIYVCGGA